ncbi:hypothetical protein GCM10029992_52090 [Glycomyces albus]
MVVLDPAGGPTMEAPAIGATNWAGGLAATEHLIELGHRRIGFIHGPKQVLASRARFDGYRAALDAAGLPYDPTLVYDGDFYHQSGFDAAKELMALDDVPTAIFASSDQMAFGAYEAIRQRGLRIPEHVSIVGFDDLPESRWTSPPLTTVRQPWPRWARWPRARCWSWPRATRSRRRAWSWPPRWSTGSPRPRPTAVARHQPKCPV